MLRLISLLMRHGLAVTLPPSVPNTNTDVQSVKPKTTTGAPSSSVGKSEEVKTPAAPPRTAEQAKLLETVDKFQTAVTSKTVMKPQEAEQLKTLRTSTAKLTEQEVTFVKELTDRFKSALRNEHAAEINNVIKADDTTSTSKVRKFFNRDQNFAELLETRQGLRQQLNTADPVKRELVLAKLDRISERMMGKADKALAKPEKALEYASNPMTPPDMLAKIAKKYPDNPGIQKAVISNENTPADLRVQLMEARLASAAPEEKREWAKTKATDDNKAKLTQLMGKLIKDADPTVRQNAATNFSLWGQFTLNKFTAGKAMDSEAEKILANAHKDPNPKVREGLAENSRATQRQVIALAMDSNDAVKKAALDRLEADGVSRDLPKQFMDADAKLSKLAAEIKSLSTKADLTAGDKERVPALRNELATARREMEAAMAKVQQYCSGRPDDGVNNTAETQAFKARMAAIDEQLEDMEMLVALPQAPLPPSVPPPPPPLSE